MIFVPCVGAPLFRTKGKDLPLDWAQADWNP